MCSSFPCSKVNKVRRSTAGSLYCKDLNCDSSPGSQDEQTCCATKGTCDRYSCPASMIKRETTTACPAEKCTDMNCCSNKKSCSSFTCPQTKLPRAGAAGLYCAGTICDSQSGSKDEGTCCVDKGSCDDLNCPDNMVARVFNANDRCPSSRCEYSDCCSPKQPCSQFQCPETMILNPGSDQMYCADTQCDTSPGSPDELHCFAERGSCDDLECPMEMVMREGVGLCPGVQCSNQNCCDPRAPCVTHDCGASDEAMVNKIFGEDSTPESQLCVGAICDHADDATTCCDARAPCDPEICNTTIQYAASETSALCARETCTEDDSIQCCLERDVCSNAGFECVGNDGLVDSPGMVRCTASPCTEADDYDICCETKDTCTSMVAGSRVAFCNSFDSYECEFGIKTNPHEVPCPNDNCNKDSCCRKATGDPLPEHVQQRCQTTEMSCSTRLASPV